MANIKQFGPIKGAGTRIVEKPAEETIQPSAFGVVSFVGPYERGEISTVTNPQYNRCPTKKEFERLMGGRVDFSVCPDCAQDHWELGEGAGEIMAVRITDGTEVTPYINLYSRHWGTDFYAPESSKDDQSQVKQPVLKIEPKNAGSWGGIYRLRVAEVTDVADIGETTLLDDAATWVVNEWTGASLQLVGVPTKTYKVVSNTADTLTVEPDSKMDTDLGASSEKGYRILLNPTVLENGKDRALGVVVRAGKDDSANTFGLDVYANGEGPVYGKPTLSMDPASQYYVEKMINDDPSNSWIKVTDLWTGGVTPDVRPSNYYGRLKNLTASQADFNVAQLREAADSNVKVVAITPNAFQPAGRYTFTWDDTAFKYAVTFAGLQGGVTVEDLPDFDVGTGEQLHKVYAGAPGLIIDHAADPADESTIVVDVLPLHANAADGFILPDAKDEPLKSFSIRSSDFDSVVVESGDLTTVGTAPTVAEVIGTVAEPYAITLDTNDKMLIPIDGRKDVTVTLTAGASQTAQDIVDDIHTAFDAEFGAGNLNPASVHQVGTDKYVKLASDGYEGGGPGSTVEFKTVTNDAYTTLGFTVGLTRGTEGTETQLVFPTQPTGGFDGGAPSDNDYLDALSTSDSPLNKLAGQGYGVVQIATPGVTSTIVQKQGFAYGEARNYAYHVLAPDNIVTESALATYLNDTIGRSDYELCYFPSFVYVNDPDKDGQNKLIPNTGMITGRIAKFARDYKGYHRPAAGVDATLPRIVDLPTGDAVLNQEILIPLGVNVILKKKGNYVIWGGRTVNKSSAFQFMTHRLQLSHYEWTFADSYDWVIFMLNNKQLWRQLLATFNAFFRPEFAAGAVVGDDLQDAVKIKIDEENNPQISIEQGDANAEIKLRLANFVERFIITISKLGVFESTSA